MLASYCTWGYGASLASWNIISGGIILIYLCGLLCLGYSTNLPMQTIVSGGTVLIYLSRLLYLGLYY